MTNEEVAEILEEIAVLLELKGENPFKTRAYSNAARTLEGLTEPLDAVIAEDRLGTIKGIGSALQEKIHALVTTGNLPYYDELKASVPAGMMAMLDIPGLGPKKVKLLHDKLEIESVDELLAACQAGKVAELSGFGARTQEKIIAGIEFRREHASRFHLSTALRAAEPFLENLREHRDVVRCAVAGSLRRMKEVIGDIDFLASSKKPEAVIDFFARQPAVTDVIARGDTKVSVILADGLQADLRVVSDDEFPFAMHYFTGSKEHNIVMRQRAIQRGLRLNEYGLFRSKTETRDRALRVKCDTEEDIFEKLDLQYVPPELREDKGEFDVAERREVPRLLEWTELKGSLHNHSNWSDGRGSLDEIADAMEELGCDYWAITDHSKSSFQANGLDSDRLLKQVEEVARVNRRLQDDDSSFRLLSGSEVDVLKGGRLDFDDDTLAQLDVVVASVHQGFTADEDEMTKRIIAAAENPRVHMLGHLTGRLLLERDGYRVNHRKVIDACAANGTWIELNANPYRLDMDWRWWPYAKEKGVRCVINCDAHRHEHAGFLRLGAGIARKGWLTRDDVINTLPLAKLKKELARKK